MARKIRVFYYYEKGDIPKQTGSVPEVRLWKLHDARLLAPNLTSVVQIGVFIAKCLENCCQTFCLEIWLKLECSSRTHIFYTEYFMILRVRDLYRKKYLENNLAIFKDDQMSFVCEKIIFLKYFCLATKCYTMGYF